jgi:hypothetical protein
MSDASMGPPILPPDTRHKDNIVRNVLLALATILTLSICYYILVILPRESRARLDFEKQKYEDQKIQELKSRQESDRIKAENETELLLCESDADTRYWTYIKLNKSSSRAGGKPGEVIYVAPQTVWDAAAREKKEALAQCQRKYGNK